MANNENINKVVYGDTTIIDITDTTAETSDVAAGKVFYARSGERSVGTGDYMDKVDNPTADNLLTTDANGQAQDSGQALTGVALKSEVGDLSSLTTDHTDNLVNAINEVYEKSGEPFRVKQWAVNGLDVTIEPCTTDKGNTQLAKMTYSIDNVEGADYQIVGMIAYEVFDADTGGNRINLWPVCQFTGNGQKELSVRWVCAGTTAKVAKRISAWILLKHR